MDMTCIIVGAPAVVIGTPHSTAVVCSGSIHSCLEKVWACASVGSMKQQRIGMLLSLAAMFSYWECSAMPPAVEARETVVLLHGLARSARSMSRLEEECFVTHSLGGILIRQLATTEPTIRIGRVVMLAPPNGGSEVVDKLCSAPLLKLLFRWANGPAGCQLGTGAAELPRALGSATFELGVIAGSRSINLLLSMLITGPDDGKVAIENTRLAGMADFLLLPVSHPFVMKDDKAIAQAITFLAIGRFDHPAGPVAPSR